MGAPILTYFSPQKTLAYWNAIKVNALHGGDRDDINWISWIDFFINDYFSSTPIGFISLILIGISVFFLLRNIPLKDINHPSLHLFILSTSFLLPVFLFVKRLWPIYLHIGLVLMVIAFLNLYANNHEHISQKSKLLLLSLAALFALLRLEPTWTEIQKLAHRTGSPTYLAKKKLWEKTKEISSALNISTLCIDPHMFYQKHMEGKRIIPFFGPFNFDRHTDCEAIFLYDIHLEKAGESAVVKKFHTKFF